MRRRSFIVGFAGTAALAFGARAQNNARVRRIAVFMPGAADNPEFEARNAAFLQGLGELGWNVGRNITINYRWGGGDVDRYRDFAKELVARGPEVILGNGTATVRALRQVTHDVPIVFANISDPIGNGLVASLARPGGNATGFISAEMGFSGKWLELLKELKQDVKNVGVMRDSGIGSQIGILGALQAIAPSLRIELHPIDIGDAKDVDEALAALSRLPQAGLIVAPGARAVLHRELITKLAAQRRLPSIYALRTFVAAGGLMSYGADTIEIYRQAAAYVDRILKGEKPEDLPVQTPTKYSLTINLKTAKALGITVPPTLIARADEVIE
jgi:putative ABC transport system substrate-binding protein